MSTPTKTYPYDPNYYVPADFEGFEVIDTLELTSTLPDTPLDEGEVDAEDSEFFEDDAIEEDDVSEDEPEVPQDIQIISQTVRTGPDGSQVVDVVIEVDDVPDAVQYDVRVTKA